MADSSRSDFSVIKRLMMQARAYWPHLSVILLFELLATPLALLTPLPLKLAVDSVLGSEPLPGFIAAILPTSVIESQHQLLIFSAVLLVAVALPSVSFGPPRLANNTRSG